MSSILLRTALCGVGAVLFSALLLALPLKTIAILTKPFSLKTFGIRKIRRWHTHTDTLANALLWISVIFCVLAPWIPYSPIIYAVWLTFTWLCAESRAVRLTEVRVRSTKTMVIFFVNLVYFTGLFAALGLFNHYMLWIANFDFAHAVMSGKALNPTFYLTDMAPASYLLQELILIWPLANLWGQFKYMRLENTFKGSNIVTYGIKSSVLGLILILCGGMGAQGLQMIYQHPLLDPETLDQAGRPMSLSEYEKNLDLTPPAPAPEPAVSPDPAAPENAGADPAPDPAAAPDPGAVPEAVQDPAAAQDPAAVPDPVPAPDPAADPAAPADPGAVPAQ